MATVPTYGPRRVQPTPLPNARVQAQETFASTGGVIGEAQAGFGEQVQRVGGAVLERDLVHYQARQKQAQEVRLLTAGRQLGEVDLLLRRRMNEVKGKAAGDLPTEIATRYDEESGRIEATLTTDDEVHAFRQSRDQRRLTLMGATNQYTVQQLDAYEDGEADSAAANAATLAVEKFDQPYARDLEIANLEAIVRRQAQRKGLGEQQVEATLDKLRSQVHEGVVARLIAADQAPAAEAYFDRALKAGHLTPQAIERMEKDVQAAGVQQAASEAADQIMGTHPPADDLLPINIDQLEAAAREMFQKDAAKRQATIDELRQRAVGINAGRKARLDHNINAVWTAVGDTITAGRSPDAVYKMPEYGRLPGTEKRRVQEEFQTDADRRLARQHAAAAHRYTEANRAYTELVHRQAQQDRADRDRQKAADDVYYTLVSDPDQFITMAEGDIRRLYPTLGPEVTAKLVSTHRSLTADAAKVRAATIDTDLFKDVANDAGLTYAHLTPAKQTREQRANLGKLHALVEAEISNRQGALKRQLTDTEKRTVMHGIIDPKVMQSDWGYDTEVPAVLVNPKDLDKVYVAFDTIPATAVGDYENYLRGEPPVSRAVKQQRMERAYGVYLAGGTRPQIEAVLKGATSVKGVK